MIKDIFICITKEELINKCYVFYLKKSKFQRCLFLIINVVSAILFFYFLQNYKYGKSTRLLVVGLVSFVVLMSTITIAFLLGRRDVRVQKWRDTCLNDTSIDILDILKVITAALTLNPTQLTVVADMNDTVIEALMLLSNFTVSDVLMQPDAMEFIVRGDSYKFPIKRRISEGHVVISKDSVYVSDEEIPANAAAVLHKSENGFVMQEDK